MRVATKLKKRIPSDEAKSRSLNPNSVQSFKVMKPQDEVRRNNGDNITLPMPSLDANCIRSSIIGLPIKPVNETERSVNSGKPRNRLFEEFFIIGAPSSTVSEVAIKDSARVEPSILLQYPDLPQNANWYYF